MIPIPPVSRGEIEVLFDTVETFATCPKEAAKRFL
jgi:hypothetical protein